MPGFDGSGPWGAGPFTGGGRGYCAARYDAPGAGRPWGRGRGLRGWGRGWAPGPAWGQPYPTAEQGVYPGPEPAGLSAELAALRARVAELERASGEAE